MEKELYKIKHKGDWGLVLFPSYLLCVLFTTLDADSNPRDWETEHFGLKPTSVSSTDNINNRK